MKLLDLSKMKVVVDWPPNIDAIDAVFDVRAKIAAGRGIAFCYGERIFHPTGAYIEPSILVHEATHAMQQSEIGGPEEWWKRYLVDAKFRFEQEIDAHKNEYAQARLDLKFRAARRVRLREIAQRLSGPLYGRMISYDQAVRQIKQSMKEAA